jgi:hypothetical protein
VDGEVKSVEELTVGLPNNNLTILDLARRFASEIQRETRSPEDARAKLRTLTRYKPVKVEQSWMVDSSKSKGLETRSYQLLFDNGLSAAAVWLKSITAPDNAPVTVAINDEGRKALSSDVSERVNRGEQVLALDLLFTGEGKPQKPGAFTYTLLLTSIGDRPIGMEAAQLVGATQWLTQKAGVQSARIEASGMRSELTSLTSAALTSGMYSELVVRNGLSSFGSLLDKPIKLREAPDMFCLDLYKVFDVDMIAALGPPVRILKSK